ncbi:MAG: GDP-mannose 4,6-dehydratase [Alphaproteobacteria bacterium]
MKNKKAIIFGVTGQDGSYLAELLLKKGYDVWGISRDASKSKLINLKKLGIDKKIYLVNVLNDDFQKLSNLISELLPDEIYYLAGQSSVGLSFLEPKETISSNVLGILNVLEVCRLISKKIRIYYAGSSECFGDTAGIAATEETNFHPQSPYAVSKTSAFWLVDNYRNAYDMFICYGILFNHESTFRSQRFVTQKIISTALRISEGSQEKLELGRLDISRDWGWAQEYVEAMWRMLQQGSAEDFIIATGETNSLEQFVGESFNQLGLDWKNHVVINQELIRPSEIIISKANPSKALKKLGWKANYKMADVVKMLLKDSQSN